MGNSEPELSYILSKHFDMSLRKSCFTDYLKVLSVVPVFKNVRDRSTAKNYYSFSLVGLWLIKSLYKLVSNRFAFFSDFNYGFRSSPSADDILTVVSDRIAKFFRWPGTTQTVTLNTSNS